MAATRLEEAIKKKIEAAKSASAVDAPSDKEIAESKPNLADFGACGPPTGFQARLGLALCVLLVSSTAAMFIGLGPGVCSPRGEGCPFTNYETVSGFFSLPDGNGNQVKYHAKDTCKTMGASWAFGLTLVVVCLGAWDLMLAALAGEMCCTPVADRLIRFALIVFAFAFSTAAGAIAISYGLGVPGSHDAASLSCPPINRNQGRLIGGGLMFLVAGLCVATATLLCVVPFIEPATMMMQKDGEYSNIKLMTEKTVNPLPQNPDRLASEAQATSRHHGSIKTVSTAPTKLVTAAPPSQTPTKPSPAADLHKPEPLSMHSKEDTTLVKTTTITVSKDHTVTNDPTSQKPAAKAPVPSSISTAQLSSETA